MKDRLRQILSARQKRHLALPGRRPSAVLIPIYVRDGQWHIVFTKRTEKVRDHKGQMSFPGGVCEAEDCSLVHTALREAEEEIGIRPGDVEVLGELDDETPWTTNYVISPFVGLIPWPYRFKVDAEEVDELVEVPLATLLDKDCLRVEDEVVNDRTTRAYFYNCLGVVVWGATARILNQLLGILVEAMDGKRRTASRLDLPSPGAPDTNLTPSRPQA